MNSALQLFSSVIMRNKLITLGTVILFFTWFDYHIFNVFTFIHPTEYWKIVILGGVLVWVGYLMRDENHSALHNYSNVGGKNE